MRAVRAVDRQRAGEPEAVFQPVFSDTIGLERGLRMTTGMRVTLHRTVAAAWLAIAVIGSARPASADDPAPGVATQRPWATASRAEREQADAVPQTPVAPLLELSVAPSLEVQRGDGGFGGLARPHRSYVGTMAPRRLVLSNAGQGEQLGGLHPCQVLSPLELASRGTRRVSGQHRSYGATVGCRRARVGVQDWNGHG